jgi:hypothetical protein
MFEQERYVFRELATIAEEVLGRLPDESLWRAYGLDAVAFWREWFEDGDNEGKPLPSLEQLSRLRQRR